MTGAAESPEPMTDAFRWEIPDFDDAHPFDARLLFAADRAEVWADLDADLVTDLITALTTVQRAQHAAQGLPEPVSPHAASHSAEPEEPVALLPWWRRNLGPVTLVSFIVLFLLYGVISGGITAV